MTADKREERKIDTHTGGQILVSTNNGMLLIRSGGLERPPIAFVTPSATSRQMYIVPPKRTIEKIDIGCMVRAEVSENILERALVIRTAILAIVPSSIHCVATIALVMSIQKSATTRPA